MAMIVKHVECRKCGKRFSLTVPDKMSAIGIRILSVCSACRDDRRQ